jgi:diguanylate cyclase (GGDEF)-like protein/PAS domain S-box-containing protein
MPEKTSVRRVNKIEQLHAENERLKAELEECRQELRVLRANEKRLQTVLNEMPMMLAALNRRREVLFWNKECERVTGYTAEEIQRNPDALRQLRLRLFGEDDDAAHAACDSDYRDREMEVTCKDGVTRTLVGSSVAGSVRIPGWHVWGVATDVTERKQAAEARATSDGLTGLKNHRAFQEHLHQEFYRAQRYGSPLSLLMMDVDKFKKYNDAFGHQAGDEVLVCIGQHLRSCARSTDFVARYGGEEFVVILPETDAAGAMAMAERFRCAVEALRWRGRRITISIGAASLKKEAMSVPAHLIAAADEAMYASKREGRNCVTHFEELR